MPLQCGEPTTMYKITKDHYVIVKPPSFEKEIQTGMLKDGAYTITDKDCYHEAKNAYGIDEEILLDEKLDYKLISFEKERLITTRIYFIDHGFRYNLLNGRVMMFLITGLFGLVNALHYERAIKNKDILKMDAVDIMKLDNPRLFREWEKAIATQESYDRAAATMRLKDVK